MRKDTYTNRKRKTQKKKIFKKLTCNSAKKSKKYTCYTNSSLHKLKDLWNKRHPEQRINTNNSIAIWKQLKYHLSNVCNNEKCWLKQQFVKFNLDNKLRNHTFAPVTPKSWKKNPREWLSSLDLLKVMKQYEKIHKDFAFIGPSPIDYDTRKMFGMCVWNDLCNFNLNTYISKKITKIGIIFNLDPHYKGGSHWVCLFIDLNKKFVFYFDSNGAKIPRQIKKCANMIMKQSTTPLKFVESHPLRHQSYNTECGIYVLYVITSLVKETKPHSYFMKNRIKDIEMFKLRKKYFNI